jgi:hypothetical protein
MKALLLACFLASTNAVAGEVRIAVGMDYDTVVGNIKRCGGNDLMASKQSNQGRAPSGLRWSLQDYNIQISTFQNSGKIWLLSYSNRKTNSRQNVKSLTLNTETKTHVIELDDVFVFAVAVHHVTLEGEPRPSAWDRAHGILSRAGIRHTMESMHGTAYIVVEPARRREAAELIKKDAAEKGYWARPAKEFQ